MSEPFLGELKLVPYNFAPRGWMYCDGSLLSIAQNTALFALLGTTYGGDGQVTFAVPDLRGRVGNSVGQGPGLSNYFQGQMSGSEAVTLTTSQLPAHTHQMNVQSGAGGLAGPVNNHSAQAPLPNGNSFAAPAGINGAMPGGTITAAGGNQPHDNVQPYLVLSYVIALEGIFPSP
jgi:microcystin-dependent protein